MQEKIIYKSFLLYSFKMITFNKIILIIPENKRFFLLQNLELFFLNFQ